VLNAPAASDLVAQARAATLARALGALHWHEGDNLRIDWRWTGGEPVLYDRYAAELVGLADVILAGAAHLSQCCGGKRQQSRSCLWS
jgi:putative tryptophan/tyrosine transport system substrate-binding protein